jgi:tRNA1(Val) A37 N6-methylase TrmN6
MFRPPEDIEGYDLAILNPPYANLEPSSETRRMRRSVGIEVPNLYAGVPFSEARFGLL